MNGKHWGLCLCIFFLEWKGLFIPDCPDVRTIFMHHSSKFHYCDALRLLALAASCLCLNSGALDVDGWSALMGWELMGLFLDASVEASQVSLFFFYLTSIFLSSLNLFVILAWCYVSWQLPNSHFFLSIFYHTCCVLVKARGFQLTGRCASFTDRGAIHIVTYWQFKLRFISPL